MSAPRARAPFDALPAIPRDAEGPVFSSPWEAQAFAMAVELHARGAFTWTEWSAALAREIASGFEDGGDESETGYYGHWLAALERLATEKQLTSSAELALRKAAWKAAAEATPHGEPIMLDAAARAVSVPPDPQSPPARRPLQDQAPARDK